MPTGFIQLSDGILVEVALPEDAAQQTAGGMARRVEAGLEKIVPVIQTIGRKLDQSWAEIERSVEIDAFEIEVGLGFELEGNVYVTKAVQSANLTLKLVLKPRRAP